VVYLALESSLIGLIAFADQLRPDAAETVLKLQKMGLEVVLMTGDRPEVAEAIASQLGIQSVFSQIRPTEKAKLIEALQTGVGRQGDEEMGRSGDVINSLVLNPKSKIVAMVGDGINDTPALAQADLGISLHSATEVAIETAGIVLMRGNLRDLIQSIKLGVATFAKIRQNLLWALAYNSLALPIAAGFLLPHFQIILSPALAATFMASSSVIVVTNSLLLPQTKGIS
jgi:Cu2+-exporting ATPase